MPFDMERFSRLRRREKVVLQVLADSILILLSFLIAMAFRLESYQFLGFLKDVLIWKSIAIAVPFTILAFSVFGLYRSLVRFVTGKILLTIAKGALVSAVVFFVSNSLLSAGVPRSVPFIYAVLLFLSVGGLRFLVRYMFRKPNHAYRTPAVVYGAGEAGLELLNTLFHGREHTPIAFIDDDPELQGLTIAGCPIHAPKMLPRLIDGIGVKVVLMAMPSLSRARRREIVECLEDLNLEIKSIPAMSDIVSGRAKISELRKVTPEDLLGRDPIVPDEDLLRANISGKVVMVTGAGGSIGSELCRQILSQHPTSLVLFDFSEFALYKIETELGEIARRMNSATRIIPILGSVQNEKRLETAIKAFRVQTIYHAAAYKHVPLVEENAVEGIHNNVFGTLTLAVLAKKLKVEHFILISTDKAVRPTNIMGATKRVAELICQALAQESEDTVFSMVRFGNVLGSSGSVIPRFQAQIEAGGPLTVTHPEINRYFMTIPEASQLVIQAGAMAKGGDVFVLDMGTPVKIVDLAVSMIRLHGLTPYFVDHPDQVLPEKGDIPICFTGLRKGEKLYEELLIGNSPKLTAHPRIMTASEAFVSMEELRLIFDRLRAASVAFDLPEIQAIFYELPLQYKPNGQEISDLLWNAGHTE
jgi:FlaA1/EpsC-like NDP-sugar epimerase